MSIEAYRASALRTDPRATEMRALSIATDRLLAAELTGARGADLVSALDDNRTLWTTLADDCAMPTNALAPATRAGIISLALFVQRQSSEVAAGRAEPSELIALNRTIIDALARRPN